jgi:hypothetical protein
MFGQQRCHCAKCLSHWRAAVIKRQLGGTRIMGVDGFFESLGEAVGSVIRFIVEGLSGFLGFFGSAISSFIAGMSKALGVTPSLLSIVVLVVGLWLLYVAVRAFIRRSIIAGVIWLVLGLWLLSGLIS